jgi:acetylornithine deacetylase
VDSLTQIRLTRELIDIDSTTPNEIQAGEFIARMLEDLGYDVTRQPVVDGRFNVIARTAADPVVVFSTHFDCVPPFFSSREAEGASTAAAPVTRRGILLAQVAAAEKLRAGGEQRIGLLYVVAEERGSEGARMANTAAPAPRASLLMASPLTTALASPRAVSIACGSRPPVARRTRACPNS